MRRSGCPAATAMFYEICIAHMQDAFLCHQCVAAGNALFQDKEDEEEEHKHDNSNEAISDAIAMPMTCRQH